jgi:hypothetical protein
MKFRLNICLFTFLILGSVSCRQEKITFETQFLRLELNSKGSVVSITDKTKSVDYLPEEKEFPLLELYKDSLYITPVSAEFNQQDSSLSLKYPNLSVANIKVRNNGSYLRLELLSVEPRNGVQAIVWGPFNTTIIDKIGETICVVRNSDFAFGLQALNINTIEGLPDGDDNTGGGGVIEPLPGQQLPDSLKSKIGQKTDVNVNIDGDMPDYIRLYRGSAAVRKVFGSELRLFSRDRRIPRVIRNWLGNKDYTQYAESIDVDFAGSAIAIFGCPERQTLDYIEEIELGEGLPHPTLNGVWIKRSDIPGQAYLLNEGDPVAALKYAKECGFKLVHMGDVFQTWGHFDYSAKRFPGGVKELANVVARAKKDGISMGVHTLTMFTQKNDIYVSPVPSDSLCKTGTSELKKEAGQSDETIYVKDPVWFRYTGNTHTVKIGKELINYRKVSDDQPWRLVDCMRGQYGTASASHAAGTPVEKLTNDSYSGFYPDIRLQDTYARRLAEVCNETGIDLMDFDGYAGESPTGHGSYGAARFIDLWYHNLDRYRLTCGAGTFHYYWHIYSFMNWGEPWYNALRESQVQYRIENQRYFERNLMPGMLGWFTLNPEFRPEEVEWIQARSAAFNAGYLIRIDESIEKNGYKDQLFRAIRDWQEARKTGAFSQEQKEKMKDPKKEFHLEKITDGKWDLYPVNLVRGFVHKFRNVQTGEPVSSKFKVANPLQEQPMQFYISVGGTGKDMKESISHIQIRVNDYQAFDLKISLNTGERLICDGEKVYMCDLTWNRLKTVYEGKIPVLANGNNDITVTSDFSSERAPELNLEFKTIGKPETVSTIK